ncbi:MAG: HAD family hydrolase [Promethearchaeota archaeon]
MKNKLKAIKGILFDFDYTLADSSRGVVKCINYALERLKFAKVPAEEVRKTIGLTLEHTFLMLLGKQHIDETERFKSYFIEKADEVMADNTTMFVETSNVIKLLHNKGLRLGIVSTKFRYRIENILCRENLLEFFDVIVGGEDISHLKPDPLGLMHAIKKLNLHTSEVIYIGDSAVDAETAQRAGIHFVAVLSGITPQDAFNQSQVIIFLKNLSELPLILGIKL